MTHHKSTAGWEKADGGLLRTSPLARQGKTLPRSRANLTYQRGGKARGCLPAVPSERSEV